MTNEAGQVLLTRRSAHVHQPNRWEFPGGKEEPGEDRFRALVREIDEELGILIRQARPLIRVPYQYPEHEVLLDVWRVERFSGQPHGREGQALEWVSPEALGGYDLPDANRPIVSAATLPSLYLVTPDPGTDEGGFLTRLTELCREGIRLIQFRARQLEGARFDRLARDAIAIAHSFGARLLVNTSPEHALALGADGVHLTRERLLSLHSRPLPSDRLLAASCHDAEAIEQAFRIGADFIVISPVLATPAHPGAPLLGWDGLFQLTERATMPAYALGGMAPEHLPVAWQQGAQGIAAIRSLWDVRLRSSSA